MRILRCVMVSSRFRGTTGCSTAPQSQLPRRYTTCSEQGPFSVTGEEGLDAAQTPNALPEGGSEWTTEVLTGQTSDGMGNKFDVVRWVLGKERRVALGWPYHPSRTLQPMLIANGTAVAQLRAAWWRGAGGPV